jgi:hypothetical protein
MGWVQFVTEIESELVCPQQDELENLLSSRIQSGDVLITDLRTLCSSKLNAMNAISLLIQKGVIVYWLQGSELVWNVEPKVMAFFQSVMTEMLGDEEVRSRSAKECEYGRVQKAGSLIATIFSVRSAKLPSTDAT